MNMIDQIAHAIAEADIPACALQYAGISELLICDVLFAPWGATD